MPKREAIVFFINALNEGGAGRVMLNLAKAFIAQGEEVTIISVTKNNFYNIPLEVNMVYLSNMNDEISGFRKMLYMPYHAFKLKQYLQKHQVKTLLSFLFRANFINIMAKLMGSGHQAKVANRSVVSRFLKEGLSGKLNMLLSRWLYPKSDLIVHQSKRMQQDFHEQVHCTVDEVVIYNPFDIEWIQKEAQKEVDFDFEKDKRYLISVGRLIDLKRFEDIIEVLSKLPLDIELIILGDGEKKEALLSLAKSLNLVERIHFVGQVKNPFPYVAQSDVFVSSSSVEGFPNVLVEAMACNTPVVSSDCVSGPREILAPLSDELFELKKGYEETAYGILYAVGDKKALKESIERALKEENVFKNRSVDFSITTISEDFLNIFL